MNSTLISIFQYMSHVSPIETILGSHGLNSNTQTQWHATKKRYTKPFFDTPDSTWLSKSAKSDHLFAPTLSHNSAIGNFSRRILSSNDEEMTYFDNYNSYNAIDARRLICEFSQSFFGFLQR